MKKPFFIFITTSIFLISCHKNDLSEGQNILNTSSVTQRQSSMFSYIESIRIDNGVDCPSNILIFPSWDSYWSTIDQLDFMIEADCDAFDATVPNNITDD